MTDHIALVVKMVLDSWRVRIKQTDGLLNQLSDEQLLCEVAPGKNRGIYLIGHLITAHDQMFRIIGLGEHMFPEYINIFDKNPDKAFSVIPFVSEIRKSWKKVNLELGKHFELMPTEEWLQPHALVSPYDFEKQPHRNKLSIVLFHSHHLSNHLGQLILLKNPYK